MKKILILTTLLFLSCCRTTSFLWHPSYEEEFKNFLLTTNREVVFIGKSHHYAINDQFGILKDILLSESARLIFIDTNKTKINIDSSNNIEGATTVEAFSNRMNRQDFIYLKSLGFNSIGNEPLSLQLPLYGTRYKMSQYFNTQYAKPLDRTYLVRVYYESGLLSNTGRVILTPFALALDALINIGKIILIPIQSN